MQVLLPEPTKIMVNKRAITVKDKTKVIDAIFDFWIKFPELRLGQLISSAILKEELFNIEDLDLVKALHSFDKKFSKLKIKK
jgi:hypothetical protein